MPPRMWPCETYVVSGASTLAPLAMGRFDRVGKHPHHVSTSTARPFDVFHNAEAGTKHLIRNCGTPVPGFACPSDVKQV